MAAIRQGTRRASLWAKINVPVVAILALAFGAYTYVSITLATKQFVRQADRTAVMVTAVLEKSLSSAMLSHRRHDAYAIISSVGELENIEQVVLLNRDGSQIIKAGDGKRVSLPGDASAVRTTRFALDDRTYRIIRPIRNLPKCYSCHGSTEPINGFLAVDLSIGAIKQAIIRNRYSAAAIGALAVVAVILAVGSVLQIVVRKPLERLIAAMSRVSDGDMTARAPVLSYDEIGQLSGHFNSMVEATHRKNEELLAAEKKVAQSERLAGIGLLAAGVAHEINNPLAGVSMSAEALLDERCTPEQRHAFAQMITEEADAIREIVHRLLALDGTAPAELKAVDLDEAVNQALDSCLPVLTANNVQVVAAPSGEYLYVAAQPSLLRQALVNVITNAAQAMPNGGRLRVSARKNRRFGIVTISDTGPGIPAEHLGRIFDPFFTTKDVGDGFGLGLSITYEIIHRQGGDITVDTSEGKGTTLTVRLPLFEKEGSTHE